MSRGLSLDYTKMKTRSLSIKTLLVFVLTFCCIGSYAQRKEFFCYDDSVEICSLADKELIDMCYDLLDTNMNLETDGIYGQMAVVDATTSEVLAWASLEKQLDGEVYGDMVYVPFKKNVCSTDILVPFMATKCLEESGRPLGGDAGCDTTQNSNAIELAMSFNQMYHHESSSEYVRKVATGNFEKKGKLHRLTPRCVKLAGMYNILQSEYNKICSDEFTFVGCFPADNPKYAICMVVIRPHKLPATLDMISKEVNQLVEWLVKRRK